MERSSRRKLVCGLIVFVGTVVPYLVTAWLVTMNSDACWYPWHDVLPSAEHLCGLGT